MVKFLHTRSQKNESERDYDTRQWWVDVKIRVEKGIKLKRGE